MDALNIKYGLSEASRKDIHQIDIILGLNDNPSYILKLLTNRYMNLSFKQLLQLTQPNNFNIIQKSNLPRNFINLLSLINNDNFFINIYPFCIDPDHFPLQKEIVKQFPETIKLVYVNNYAEKITDDLQIMFKDTLEQIFQNPTLFCPDIFWVFIFKWSKNVLNEAIKSFDINGFPKIYLYDLLNNFSIPPKILNKFRISELGEVNDIKKRVYILNVLLKNFIKTKKIDLIQNIDIHDFNYSEIECFTKNCYNFMTKNQVDLIDISHLTNETALLFIQNNIKKISQKHIEQINFAKSEIAQIIIDSNHLQNLNKKQIQSINISEINENLLQKLIKCLNNQNHFDFLSPEQMQFIEIKHIDINALNNFIQVAAKYMHDEEIQKIDFSYFHNDQNTIKSILQTLNSFNKLNVLNIEQIRQINIFDLNDEELIKTMFNLKSFASSFIHINCDCINGDIIPLINFENVDIGFLNYFINTSINDLSDDQVRQINLNYLKKSVLEKLVLQKIDILNNDSIQLIQFENLDKEVINLIVQKKYNVISNDQIGNIDINLLTIANQLNLLNFRLNDLKDNQIQYFNTSNLQIAKICLKKRFNLLNKNQINSIDVIKLETNLVEKMFDSKNNIFNKLDVKQIQMVDLTKIKESNYDVYFDLILLKTNNLSIEQFMSVDWCKENFKFTIAARIFMKNIGMNRDFEDILIGNGEITEEKLKLMPNEFKVAIINSRFLHNNYDFIPLKLREYYFQAIKIMFQLPDKFKQSVEYIINNWSIDSRDSIAQIITDLKIISFSKETINSLLKYYILELSEKQIQSLNISNVPDEIIEESLLNRANCFLGSQFSKIAYPESNKISLQLHLLTDKSIPNLYIKDLTIILMNFVINKKLNLMNKDQIQEIKISDLKQVCLDKLIKHKIQELSSIQVSSILISVLNQKQLNHLLIYRAESMSQKQIEKINLTKLSKEALSSLLQKNKSKIPDKNIKLQITGQILNNLDPSILNNFLVTHINILTIDQIQGINVSSPLITARLINARLKDLSKNQIQKIDWSDNSPIKSKFKTNDDSFSIISYLIKAHRFKDLTQKQLDNSINYKRYENIMEIMDENLLGLITKENIEKINLVDFEKKATNDNFLKLLNLCMTKFSDDQIHVLNTEDHIIVKLIIKYECDKKLTINQIQKIDINKLQECESSILILSRSKDFSEKQVQSMKLPLYSNILIELLKNQVKSLTINQIQSINKKLDSINAILLYNRIDDLTSKQINEYFDFSLIDYNLKKMNITKDSYQILREAHRFRDLNENLLNKIITINGANVIEILHENLLDKIKGNFLEIKIKEVHKEASYEDYLKILNYFIKRLNCDCFKEIDTSDYNVAKIIIKNDLISQLYSEQKQNFNIKSFLNFDDLQLIKFSYPFDTDEKYDIIIKGIILFKYLKYKINDNPIVDYIKSVKIYFDNEITLANFIICASEALQLKDFKFESVSEDFFKVFKKLDCFKNPNEYIFKWIICKYNITPNAFQIFLHQKAKHCTNANMVKMLLNPQSEIYRQLPKEYIIALSEITT